ncbi:Ig-like domain-containing protein [Vulgatibacter incomptus]|uniref:Ig-like domain-containing protein n=1 Tax=Vulgatibacter incomptus TaxID=1391653 RepID=UPI000682A65C|nr:Ig-like domain-containing protein [Vulgatibacter incomptus]
MVVRVAVTPAAPTVKENKSIQLTARAYDEGDREVTGKAVTWASSDHGIALVSSAGRVTGVHAGTTTITATIDGVEAEVDVVVNQADVSAVYILGGPYTLRVGDVVTLQVQVVDDTGTVLQGRTVTWSSADPDLVSVDSNGTATALSHGIATISAAVGGRMGQTTVTVTPPAPEVSLAMGEAHTCALLGTGDVWCWGINFSGQLGSELAGIAEYAPVPAAAGFSFRSLTSGSQHTCGVTFDDQVYCWGENEDLQLGDPDVEYTWEPTHVSSTPFALVGAMYFSTCATILQGNPYCWGYNSDDHEFGAPTIWGSADPVQVSSPAAGQPLLALTAIRGGAYHTCGATEAGELFCWGYNNRGQVGTGNTNVVERPFATKAGGVVDFALGVAHTCAVMDSGEVSCWGRNLNGQLGTGGTSTRIPTPTPVALPPGLSVVAIAAGEEHTCALDSTGSAWCWGGNWSGQLGRPGGDSSVPVLVSGDLTFRAIAARADQTCAVATDESIYCWGDNWGGQLGIGDFVDWVDVPTAVQF